MRSLISFSTRGRSTCDMFSQALLIASHRASIWNILWLDDILRILGDPKGSNEEVYVLKNSRVRFSCSSVNPNYVPENWKTPSKILLSHSTSKWNSLLLSWGLFSFNLDSKIGPFRSVRFLLFRVNPLFFLLLFAKNLMGKINPI